VFIFLLRLLIEALINCFFLWVIVIAIVRIRVAAERMGLLDHNLRLQILDVRFEAVLPALILIFLLEEGKRPKTSNNVHVW